MIVTLCDSGVLIAAIDPGQGETHARCVAQVKAIQGRLVVTWPCLAEAMHIAWKIGRRPLQRTLWRLVGASIFDFAELNKQDAARMDQLMERYSSLPMDLADASLYVVAEKVDSRQILTLDNHFRIYRFDDGGFFDVVL